MTVVLALVWPLFPVDHVLAMTVESVGSPAMHLPLTTGAPASPSAEPGAAEEGEFTVAAPYDTTCVVQSYKGAPPPVQSGPVGAGACLGGGWPRLEQE